MIVLAQLIGGLVIVGLVVVGVVEVANFLKNKQESVKTKDEEVK